MRSDKYPNNPVDLHPDYQIQIRFLRVSSGIKNKLLTFCKNDKKETNKKNLRNKRLYTMRTIQ